MFRNLRINGETIIIFYNVYFFSFYQKVSMDINTRVLEILQQSYLVRTKSAHYGSVLLLRHTIILGYHWKQRRTFYVIQVCSTTVLLHIIFHPV